MPLSAYSPSQSQILFTSHGYTVELCHSPESLKAAYRLRYEAYLPTGMIEPNALERFTDEFDAQANAYTILVSKHQRAIGTIRFLVYDRAHAWKSPYLSTYHPAGLTPLTDHGIAYMETGRLAISEKLDRMEKMQMVGILFRMHTSAGEWFGVDKVLVHVKQKDVQFYHKIGDFVPFVEHAPDICPTAQILISTVPHAYRVRWGQWEYLEAEAEEVEQRFLELTKVSPNCPNHLLLQPEPVFPQSKVA